MPLLVVKKKMKRSVSYTRFFPRSLKHESDDRSLKNTRTCENPILSYPVSSKYNILK